MNVLLYLKRGLIGLLLLSTISIPSTASASEKSIFLDLPTSHWAYQEIAQLTSAGIISGFPDHKFYPADLVTYGEFIKMAATTAGLEKFTTAAQGNGQIHWAQPYYLAGLQAGYYSQIDIPEAVLSRSIPRGFMALVVASVLGDTEQVSENYSKILSGIQDVDSRTSYEFEIVKAYDAGIVTGFPDGTFRPERPLTRAEAAIVIERLRNRLAENVIDGGKAAENSESAESVEGVEKEPWVIEGSVLPDEPEGTITLTIQSYGNPTREQLSSLHRLLAIHLPLQADAILDALTEFASHKAGDSGQGIRKQYFDLHPVLMERIDDTVRIFVFPVGYTSRTWNTSPGEVNEEFF